MKVGHSHSNVSAKHLNHIFLHIKPVNNTENIDVQQSVTTSIKKACNMLYKED